MDSAVSWQETILISKLRYPNADPSTILYFAKQIYLARYKTSIHKELASSERLNRRTKERFVLQGASI